MKRKLLTTILDSLLRKEYILITGARQVGKTTLLKQIQQELRERKESTQFLTLEDPEVLAAVDEHPGNVLRYLRDMPQNADIASGSKLYLLLDEIQLSANPSNLLKYLYDLHGAGLKIIATGSSAFYLDTRFKDSLAGRMRIYELFPLDFEEFLELSERTALIEETKLLREKPAYRSLRSRELRAAFDEYLVFGGYPAVVSEKDPREKQSMLGELVKTYLKKDVFESENSNYLKVYRLAVLLAHQTGKLINTNELARTLSYNARTIDQYLYILQKSYYISLVRPFFRNIRNELTKMPKVYFHDIGLRNSLLNYFDKPQARIDKGQLIENYLFIRLRQL